MTSFYGFAAWFIAGCAVALTSCQTTSDPWPPPDATDNDVADGQPDADSADTVGPDGLDAEPTDTAMDAAPDSDEPDSDEPDADEPEVKPFDGGSLADIDATAEDGTPWINIADTDWAGYGCPSPCSAAYLALADSFEGTGQTVPPGELDAMLSALAAADEPTEFPDYDAAELAQEIVWSLGVADLLTDLQREPPPPVWLLKRQEKDDFDELELLLDDPHVGFVQAKLLVPAHPLGGALAPAILGLHGHKGDKNVFAKTYHGRDLAARGYYVIMPTLRAMRCDAGENQAAAALLQSGLTLMGLRVYEALRMRQILLAIDGVDPSRLAVMGHSGGSSTSNLLLRLPEQFDAGVVDYTVDYRNLCGPELVHCETVPDLFSLFPLINDKDSFAPPRLRLPYGYPKDEHWDLVRAFLAENL